MKKIGCLSGAQSKNRKERGRKTQYDTFQITTETPSLGTISFFFSPRFIEI